MEPKKYLLRALLTALCLLTAPALFAQVSNPSLHTTQAQEIKLPEFNGDLESYLTENIHYPDQAIKDSLSGMVVVKFTISKEGKVDQCKVVKSVASLLDDEAVRVAKATSGKWIPGQLDGKNADTEYFLPVVFMLDQE